MKPDRGDLGRFVDALFRYAEEGSFVSLRAFSEHKRGVPPVKIEAVAVNGDLTKLVDRAEIVAALAADASEPAVFAPPVAVFLNPRNAGEKDLAAALAAAAELDHEAQAGLARLRAILGPPTVVVESGGEWEPGKPKLHAYWRYAEPATGAALERSKQLRIAMLTLVGGDPTNGPDSHPIRWPGSWHRKGEPRLCRIVEYNPDAEIDIDDVLDIVIAACKADGKSPRKPSVNGGGRPIEPGVVDTVRFTALQEMSDVFMKAWRERFYKEDGTTPDHSKCDWHIAMEATRAGWSDEEVAALVQAFRNKVGEGDKATPQYLGHTIQKVSDAVKSGITRYDPDIARAEEAADDGDDTGTLAALSNRLGVRIGAFVVVGKEDEPATGYIVKLANGASINITSPHDLLSQRVVRAKVLGASGHVMRSVKQHEWDAIVSLMMSAATRQDPADSNPVTQITSAVAEYIESQGSRLCEWDEDGSDIIFSSNRPIIKDGLTHITIKHFHQWSHSSGYPWNGDEIRTLLRLAGSRGYQVSMRIGHSVVKRWLWNVPGSGQLSPVVPGDKNENGDT